MHYPSSHPHHGLHDQHRGGEGDDPTCSPPCSAPYSANHSIYNQNDEHDGHRNLLHYSSLTNFASLGGGCGGGSNQFGFRLRDENNRHLKRRGIAFEANDDFLGATIEPKSLDSFNSNNINKYSSQPQLLMSNSNTATASLPRKQSATSAKQKYLRNSSSLVSLNDGPSSLNEGESYWPNSQYSSTLNLSSSIVQKTSCFELEGKRKPLISASKSSNNSNKTTTLTMAKMTTAPLKSSSLPPPPPPPRSSTTTLKTKSILRQSKNAPTDSFTPKKVLKSTTFDSFWFDQQQTNKMFRQHSDTESESSELTFSSTSSSSRTSSFDDVEPRPARKNGSGLKVCFLDKVVEHCLVDDDDEEEEEDVDEEDYDSLPSTASASSVDNMMVVHDHKESVEEEREKSGGHFPDRIDGHIECKFTASSHRLFP